MAGRRHHFLPRFLQRPFAFRQKGKHFYVYAHHRAHGAYATNVMELGQALDFYGGPDDTLLDDGITRGEKQLALTVNRLNAGAEVSPDDIATLISALGFRTKATREALMDLVPPLMEGIRDAMLGGRRLQDELRESLRDPRRRKKLIYEEIRKKMGHLGREQQAKMYAFVLPKWTQFVEENERRLLAEAQALTARALDGAMEQASKIGDSGFLKALAKDPHMPTRATRMAAEMVFEIWEAPKNEPFILGDCGPVALFNNGKPGLILGSINDEVEMDMVFLPISPRRCIVARKPSSVRTIDIQDLNRCSAAASHDFFISNQQDSTQLAELRQAIATIGPIATTGDIAEALALE
jgi:hypothetical protein